MASNPPGPPPRPPGLPPGPPSSSGIRGTLSRPVLGFPLWVWGVILVGGVTLYFVYKHFAGGQANSAQDQTSTNAGSANALLQNGIDPYTGVPLSIEGATNPNTGLPAYYGGSGVTNGASSTDLSSITAALTQIENQITALQQNPTKGGGTGSTGEPKPKPVIHPPTTTGGTGPQGTRQTRTVDVGLSAPAAQTVYHYYQIPPAAGARTVK